MEISKPDYTFLWSSGGSIVAPSNVKIQTGWTAEVPPFQWENWSQNRQDQAISHILQKGVSVWSSAGEYWFTTNGERSYVQGSDGQIYVALQDSVGQDPTTATAFWRLAFPTTGRLVRTSVYRNSGGVLQVSVNGAAYVTASSTFIPLTTTAFVIAEVLGAGGGGGGTTGTGAAQTAAGSGGGGGGYAKSIITAGFSGVTVTVGAGGTSSAGNAGTSGGTSSFGGLLAASGGSGGTLGSAASNTSTVPVGQAAGGNGSGGNIFNAIGGIGTYALYAPSSVSGAGGGTVFGGGAPFASGISSGNNGVSPGAGGSGGTLPPSSASGAAGGAGANGLVIIQEFS